MNIAQLTEIVSTADNKYIIEKMKEFGYTDCGRTKVQKNLNMAALFLGYLTETEEYINEQTSLIFKGGLYTGVQNHEAFEFIVIASYDSNNPYPVTLHTWARRAYAVTQPTETAVAEDEDGGKRKKKKIKKTKVVTTVEETTEIDPDQELE